MSRRNDIPSSNLEAYWIFSRIFPNLTGIDVEEMVDIMYIRFKLKFRDKSKYIVDIPYGMKVFEFENYIQENYPELFI